MALFFTATAVSPAIFPWEGQAKTLERLASCPVTVEAIIFGDMIASTLFGIGITLITVLIGVGILGLTLFHALTLLASILVAACCFSAIGMLLAVPPTNVPSNIMMLSSLIKFPLVFISGIFIPLQQMPPWGLALAAISPLTYFTDIVRYSFNNGNYFAVSTDITALFIFTILFAVAAMYLHKRTMPGRI
jgi:ABC-2 type transport system permease protein